MNKRQAKKKKRKIIIKIGCPQWYVDALLEMEKFGIAIIRVSGEKEQKTKKLKKICEKHLTN